jgi:hypothetical protein
VRRAAACLVLAGVLAGCSGPRSGISVTSAVDACAAALPVARAAVHNHGTLVHVHAVRHGDLMEVARQLGLPPPPSSSPPATLPPETTPPATPRSTPTTSSAPSTLLSGTSLPPEPEPRACMVVFHGNYRPALVKHPIGASHGRYAIALVWLHKARLILVIVTDKLPKVLG